MPLCTKLSIKLFTFILLAAALGFTSLQAQTVAYVANSGANSVSVINTATNTVTATIPVGNSPVGVVFSPDGTRAYVANSADGTVSVINTSSNAVVATVTLASGSSPFKLAVTPDGKSLYVSDLGNAAVTVINTASNTISATIPVNNVTSDVVVLPSGTSAYAADITGNVSVINTSNNTVVGPLINLGLIGPVTVFLSVTPNGGHIYAGSGGGSTVEVINTGNNTATDISGVPGATDVLVTEGGDTVYVTDTLNNNKVSVIDTATSAVQPDLIAVGNGPQFMAATPDSSFVYVTNFSDNTVSIIATTNNTVGAPVTVGANPEGIAIANVTPVSCTGVASSISANFNGTSIAAGDMIWFSAVAKASGLGSAPATIFVRQAAITFTANGTPFTVSVPDANLVFNPSATTATTTFDTSANRWQTVVPAKGLAGNVFLDGAELMLPNGLPGGVKNVTWTAAFATDTAGVTLQWQWAAAVYTSLGGAGINNGPDLNALEVKPVDDNKASQFQNSDHAGTPEDYKSFVTGGATGGGGSNFTGSYSGTNSVRPVVVSSCSN